MKTKQPSVRQIRIAKDGTIRFIHNDDLMEAFAKLGTATTQRASHVEPTTNGQWQADMAPVGGPVLGPFLRRDLALAAETTWLLEHKLPTPTKNTNQVPTKPTKKPRANLPKRPNNILDSTEYENGMWSGHLNHHSDRCKTLKQIAKESGYKYALGYRDGRAHRKAQQPTS